MLSMYRKDQTYRRRNSFWKFFKSMNKNRSNDILVQVSIGHFGVGIMRLEISRNNYGDFIIGFINLILVFASFKASTDPGKQINFVCLFPLDELTRFKLTISRILLMRHCVTDSFGNIFVQFCSPSDFQIKPYF